MTTLDNFAGDCRISIVNFGDICAQVTSKITGINCQLLPNDISIHCRPNRLGLIHTENETYWRNNANLCTISCDPRSSACSGQVSASVDGALIGSGPFGSAPAPGTDSGFFDSLSVINTAPTITKTFVPTTVPLNDASTLTIAILNPSPTDQATNVAFTDTLPAGITPGSGVGLGGCGALVVQISGNPISLSGATIAAKGMCTFQIFVNGALTGAWLNSTSAVTSDQGTGNAAVATLVVTGPPSISKSFTPSKIATGGTSTLTVQDVPAVNVAPVRVMLLLPAVVVPALIRRRYLRVRSAMRRTLELGQPTWRPECWPGRLRRTRCLSTVPL